MREKSPQSLKSDEEHSIRPPCPRPLPVRISIESISLSSLFAFVPASFFFSPLKEKNMNYFLYFLCVPLFVFYLSFLLYSWTSRKDKAWDSASLDWDQITKEIWVSSFKRYNHPESLEGKTLHFIIHSHLHIGCLTLYFFVGSAHTHTHSFDPLDNTNSIAYFSRITTNSSTYRRVVYFCVSRLLRFHRLYKVNTTLSYLLFFSAGKISSKKKTKKK